MDIKVISRNVGLALLVSALFMFLSAMISVIDGMDSAFAPLAISCIVTAVVGAFPFIFVRQTPAVSVKDGFLIIVLSWLLSFVFGMLPYILWGGEFNLVNAWFESVSGYTTTGSTILTDIEALPRSLLFWRSSTHFIGGLGVVVFLLLVLPSVSPFRLKLTNIEVSSLSREGYRYRSMRVVQVIILVYIGITVLSALCLMLAGMNVFDAVNHAFSIAATGGFSTRNLSIAYYDSTAINCVVIFFMLLSSLHFGLLFSAVITRSLKPLTGSPAVRYYFASIIVMTFIIACSLRFQGGYDNIWHALSDSLCQVVCYVTTTGFGMTDNSQWPLVAGMVLMFAALQCGCSGSTVGGLKADRIYVAFRVLVRQIRSNLRPSSVSSVRVGKHYMADSEALPVLLYIVLYLAFILIGILLLLMFGVDVKEAVSGAVSSMGNVGPGLGSISALDSYSAQPAAAKIVYTIGMILGRLEIYPVIAVFYLIFRRDR